MRTKTITTILSLTLVLLTTTLMAQEKFQDISIKGVKIGMTRDEFILKFGGAEIGVFTVGRAGNIYPIRPEFKNNVLVYFSMFFKSSSFDDVLGAVKEKYPQMKCSDSKVSNSMGASFQQVECVIEGTNPPSLLVLTRFVRDIKTSALVMLSKEELDNIEKKASEKKKDI